MKTSNKLKQWMRDFYGWSSDQDNPETKIGGELKELIKIIKEIRQLENKNWIINTEEVLEEK